MSNLTARTSWTAKPSGPYESRRYPIASGQQLYEGGFVQLDAAGNLVPYTYLQTGIDGGFALGYVQPTPSETVKNGLPAPYLLGDSSLTPVPVAIVYTGEEIQFDVAITGIAAQTDVGKLVYLPLQDNAPTLTSGGQPGSALITGGSAALAGGGAGNVDNGAHTYYFTAVTPKGETGPIASTVVTVADKSTDGKVTVTWPTQLPVGSSFVNVYRSKAATTTPAFLVAQIAVTKQVVTATAHAITPGYAAATATDNTADSGLGAGPPAASNGWPIGEVTEYLATGFGSFKLWSYEARRRFAGF